MMNGALVIDKPRGLTSHDVVAIVRRILRQKRVGHLGTLDPIATGVLPLLVGRATRLARFYERRRKRYEGTIRFGFATDTYDADGRPLSEEQPVHGEPTQGEPVQLDRAALEAAVAGFVGKFEQMPPPYSAKKVGGVAAHELARQHKPVTLKPVEVEVYEFRVLEVDGPRAGFSIECSAGTYIRSLAHEVGQRLGVGAHLAQIRRTASGEFGIDQARKLEELEKAAGAGRAAELLIPLEKLLPDLPRTVVDEPVERRVRHGAKFEVNLNAIQPGEAGAELDREGWRPYRLRVCNGSGELIAIAEAVVPRVFRPVVVLESAK